MKPIYAVSLALAIATSAPSNKTHSQSQQPSYGLGIFVQDYISEFNPPQFTLKDITPRDRICHFKEGRLTDLNYSTAKSSNGSWAHILEKYSGTGSNQGTLEYRAIIVEGDTMVHQGNSGLRLYLSTPEIRSKKDATDRRLEQLIPQINSMRQNVEWQIGRIINQNLKENPNRRCFN